MGVMTVEEIVKRLDAHARGLRENYGRAHSHLPIEYINGVEDAAELVSKLAKEETGTDVDH